MNRSSLLLATVADLLGAKGAQRTMGRCTAKVNPIVLCSHSVARGGEEFGLIPRRPTWAPIAVWAARITYARPPMKE